MRGLLVYERPSRVSEHMFYHVYTRCIQILTQNHLTRIAQRNAAAIAAATTPASLPTHALAVGTAPAELLELVSLAITLRTILN